MDAFSNITSATIFNHDKIKNSNILLLSGQSKSGKSTLARTVFEDLGYIRLSIDKFANLKYGQILSKDPTGYDIIEKFLIGRNEDIDNLVPEFIHTTINDFIISGEKLIIEGLQLVREWESIIFQGVAYRDIPFIHLDIDEYTYIWRCINSRYNYNFNIEHSNSDIAWGCSYRRKYLPTMKKNYEMQNQYWEAFQKYMNGVFKIQTNDILTYVIDNIERD